MEKNVKLRFILNCCSLQKIQDFKIGFLLLFYLFLFLFTDFCIAESKFIDLTDHHKKPPVIYLKPKGLENWDKFISTNIKINGSNRTKIECGDSVKLDFSFFPGRQKAEFSVFIDCNNNDILDAEDIQYGKSITFIDGDSNDLDKKLNSHYSTAISNLPETDIPVSSIIGRTIFFQINDGINCSIAVLKIKPAIKSFFFSGLIRNPENKANLAVIIQSNDRIRQKKYLILTDEYGYFYAEIPDCSNDPYYFVSSDDLFNVLNNNYFAPLPEVLDKRIKPNKIYLSYSIKTSFLNGRITDLEGNSIQNVRVLVQNAENSSESTMYSSVCDSAGYFRIGVIPGLYKISLASETLFPNYMFPEENTPVNVLEGQAKDIQLKVLKTDSFIKGKVIIEGKAARDIYVAAWNDKGSIWGKTKNDGTFLLNVNKNYHYNIDVNPESIPPGYFPVFSNTRTVKPDSGIVEFIFKKASVRFGGFVKVKDTGIPVENTLITATDGKHTIFTRTDKNGHYSLLGEGGHYYLIALDNLTISQADTNLVANNGYYNIDFQLTEPKSNAGINKNEISDKFVYRQAELKNSVNESKIKYVLPKYSHVTLKIYDLSGKEVATLEDKKKSAGVYEIYFDSLKLDSGIYIYKLTTGQFSETRKFVIAR